LCTGNYYRSRFAEILFDTVAERLGLPWRASSRGLAIEFIGPNDGPMSPATMKRLTTLGICYEDRLRLPQQASQDDLERADLVVALKEAEHRPLLRERIPEWEDRVEYWHIHDLDFAPASKALAEIEARVAALVARLQRDFNSAGAY
jgi:protein-tyrosine phosphatase